MFKNLPASSGNRRRVVTGKTATASIILHAALLTAAVYATVGMSAEDARQEELVEFLEIEEQDEIEEEQPEEPDEPPPPPPPAQTATIEPPTEAPPTIPDVDLSAPAVSAQDFTGIGQAAEVATPPPPPVEEPAAGPAFAYEVAVLSRPPRLNNASTVASVMERLYPRILQDAGIGGTVIVQFVIEANGTVDMSSVQIIESPHEQLSNATVQALDRFRFTPGQYNRQNVRVLTQMPITWQPQR